MIFELNSEEALTSNSTTVENNTVPGKAIQLSAGDGGRCRCGECRPELVPDSARSRDRPGVRRFHQSSARTRTKSTCTRFDEHVRAARVREHGPPELGAAFVARGRENTLSSPVFWYSGNFVDFDVAICGPSGTIRKCQRSEPDRTQSQKVGQDRNCGRNSAK